MRWHLRPLKERFRSMAAQLAHGERRRSLTTRFLWPGATTIAARQARRPHARPATWYARDISVAENLLA